NQVINTGIGNAHDLVGRYFADHIQIDTAGIFPLRDDISFELYTNESRKVKHEPKHVGAAATLLGNLILDDKTQRTQGTVSYSCKIVDTYLSDYFLHSRSQEITSASSVERMADRLRTIVSSAGDAVSIASDRAMGRQRKFYKAVTTQEQAPNPSSRITLG